MLFLDISVEVAKKRLLARGRMDDDPKVVEHRLETYEEHTKPIIDYFSQLGLVKVVEGDAEVEVIFERILGVLE